VTSPRFVEAGVFRRRRWIVPAAHLGLLGAAITTFPGLGRRAAIDRAVLRGVLGSTLWPRVFARPLTSDAADVLHRAITEVRAALRCDRLVGTQLPWQGFPKVVAALLDSEDVPRVFFKAVRGAEPARLCRVEAETLTVLSRTTLSDSAPTLVASSFDQTFAVVVTEAIPGARLPASAMPPAPVAELAGRIGGVHTSRETVAEFAARAARMHRSAPAPRDGVGTAAAFDALAAVSDGGAAPLSLRLAHGDFVPWNFRVHGSTVVVVDWELCADRPPLWDMCHFLVQPVAMGFVAPRQRPWHRIVDALRDAAPSAGVSPARAADLARLYLAYSLVDGVGDTRRARAVRLALLEASRR
jgi:phosphotransferase family enzyme